MCTGGRACHDLCVAITRETNHSPCVSICRQLNFYTRDYDHNQLLTINLKINKYNSDIALSYSILLSLAKKLLTLNVSK